MRQSGIGRYAARSEPANAVHDPLCANALALGSCQTPIVIVVCDLIAVNDAMVRAVRQRVDRAIVGATVWLAATHTHSGPAMARRLVTPDPDPGIVECVVAGATQAVMKAVGGMRPVRAAWVSGLIEGIATNRDHIEGKITSISICCASMTSAMHQNRPRSWAASPAIRR